MAGKRSSTRDDFDRVKDAAHKLRSENRKLRKQNAILRKQLNRFSENAIDKEFEDEEINDLTIVLEDSSEQINCPKCGGEPLKEVQAGKFLIKMCSCGFRKRSSI